MDAAEEIPTFPLWMRWAAFRLFHRKYKKLAECTVFSKQEFCSVAFMFL